MIPNDQIEDITRSLTTENETLSILAEGYSILEESKSKNDSKSNSLNINKGNPSFLEQKNDSSTLSINEKIDKLVIKSENLFNWKETCIKSEPISPPPTSRLIFMN